MPGLGGAGYDYTPLLLADSDSYKVQRSLQNNWVLGCSLQLLKAHRMGVQDDLFWQGKHTPCATPHLLCYTLDSTHDALSLASGETHTHARKESSFSSLLLASKRPHCGVFQRLFVEWIFLTSLGQTELQQEGRRLRVPGSKMVLGLPNGQKCPSLSKITGSAYYVLFWGHRSRQELSTKI